MESVCICVCICMCVHVHTFKILNGLYVVQCEIEIGQLLETRYILDPTNQIVL